MSAKHANIVLIDMATVTAQVILRELADDVLGSESLESLLTAMMQGGEQPMIIVVLRLSRFRVGIS